MDSQKQSSYFIDFKRKQNKRGNKPENPFSRTRTHMIMYYVPGLSVFKGDEKPQHREKIEKGMKISPLSGLETILAP